MNVWNILENLAWFVGLGSIFRDPNQLTSAKVSEIVNKAINDPRSKAQRYLNQLQEALGVSSVTQISPNLKSVWNEYRQQLKDKAAAVESKINEPESKYQSALSHAGNIDVLPNHSDKWNVAGSEASNLSTKADDATKQAATLYEEALSIK